MIVLLLLPGVSKSGEIIERTVARVGGHVITEGDIKWFYSLFINPGQPPFFGEREREFVLNELVQYLALQEYVQTYHFHFDEYEMQSRAGKFLQGFQESFPTRVDYLILLRLLNMEEYELREKVTEYFMTMQKMDIVLQSKMQEEHGTEMELVEEKRYLYDLLILPAELKEQERLFTVLFNTSRLEDAHHAFQEKGIDSEFHRNQIATKEELKTGQLENIQDLFPGGISLPFLVGDDCQIIQLHDIAWHTLKREEVVGPGEIGVFKEKLLEEAQERFPVEYYE